MHRGKRQSHFKRGPFPNATWGPTIALLKRLGSQCGQGEQWFLSDANPSGALRGDPAIRPQKSAPPLPSPRPLMRRRPQGLQSKARRRPNAPRAPAITLRQRPLPRWTEGPGNPTVKEDPQGFQSNEAPTPRRWGPWKSPCGERARRNAVGAAMAPKPRRPPP